MEGLRRDEEGRRKVAANMASYHLGKGEGGREGERERERERKMGG